LPYLKIRLLGSNFISASAIFSTYALASIQRHLLSTCFKVSSTKRAEVFFCNNASRDDSKEQILRASVSKHGVCFPSPAEESLIVTFLANIRLDSDLLVANVRVIAG
jgi:hypothetical protein